MIRSSEAYPTRLCAGRPAAQTGLPERTTLEATEGQAIHAAHRDPSLVATLTPQQFEVWESQDNARKEIIATIFAGVDIASLRVIQEDMMYVRYQGKRIISGHPDYVVIGAVGDKNIGLIVDWKTGWLSADVQEPELNDQIRSYELALYQDFDLDEVYVTIIPRFGKARTPAVYTAMDQPNALQDIANVYLASQAPDAKRTPSVEACKYCLAVGTTRCPESMNQVAMATRMVTINALPPAQIAVRLEQFELAEKIIKREREIYKEMMLQIPDAIPGFHLVSKEGNREINDGTAVFNLVADLLTSEEFATTAKPSITKLEALLKTKLRGQNVKGKEAAARINELLAPAISRKKEKVSIKRIKDAALPDAEESEES